MRFFPLLAPLLLATGLPAQNGESSVLRYGQGSAGKGGFIPDAWVKSGPYINNPGFGFTVERTLGKAFTLLLVSGRSAQAKVFGFDLLVDPTHALFFVGYLGQTSGLAGKAGDGTALAPLPIPNDSRLLGMELFSQWIVLDAAAPFGLAASNGIQTTFNQGAFVVIGGTRSWLHHVPGTKTITKVSISGNITDAQVGKDGTLAFLVGNLVEPRFRIIDITTNPPKLKVGINTGKNINCMSIHPDQSRAYLVVPSGSVPEIQIYDISPKSKTFGQKLGKVGGIPSFGLSDMEGSSISANGKILVVAVMGFVGRKSILVIDVDPTSPKRDQMIRQIPVSIPGFMTDVDVSGSGALGYACFAQLGKTSILAQILLATGKVLKQIKVNADFSTDIDLDPRERFCVVAFPNSNNVGVLDLRAGAGFFTLRLLPQVMRGAFFSVALDPTATTVYGIGNSGGGLYGWEIQSGKVVQNLATTLGGYCIAVR